MDRRASETSEGRLGDFFDDDEVIEGREQGAVTGAGRIPVLDRLVN